MMHLSTARRWRYIISGEYEFLKKRFSGLSERLRNWRRFWAEYDRYNEDATLKALPVHLYPQLDDATAQTKIEPIYFYQDAWAFEKIVTYKPEWHLDIGSQHKFVALLSKVVKLTMVDIRPLSLPLATLTFKQGDILNLPYPDQSVPSLSCLCVLEHIGLGRYGDTLNPEGSALALEEIKRVIQPGGYLVLSVPIDDESRIYFNAHRAFKETELFKWFEPFEILERRYIFGNDFLEEKRRGFGVGCYWLKRPLS